MTLIKETGNFALNRLIAELEVAGLPKPTTALLMNAAISGTGNPVAALEWAPDLDGAQTATKDAVVAAHVPAGLNPPVVDIHHERDLLPYYNAGSGAYELPPEFRYRLYSGYTTPLVLQPGRYLRLLGDHTSSITLCGFPGSAHALLQGNRAGALVVADGNATVRDLAIMNFTGVAPAGPAISAKGTSFETVILNEVRAIACTHLADVEDISSFVAITSVALNCSHGVLFRGRVDRFAVMQSFFRGTTSSTEMIAWASGARTSRGVVSGTIFGVEASDRGAAVAIQGGSPFGVKLGAIDILGCVSGNSRIKPLKGAASRDRRFRFNACPEWDDVPRGCICFSGNDTPTPVGGGFVPIGNTNPAGHAAWDESKSQGYRANGSPGTPSTQSLRRSAASSAEVDAWVVLEADPAAPAVPDVDVQLQADTGGGFVDVPGATVKYDVDDRGLLGLKFPTKTPSIGAGALLRAVVRDNNGSADVVFGSASLFADIETPT